MKKEKLLKALKKLGTGGAVIACFIYSDVAQILFQLSGKKPKQSLFITVTIITAINIFLLFSGILSGGLEILLSILDKIGLDSLVAIIDTASDYNGLQSLTTLFIIMLIPVTFISAGVGHIAGIVYAANVGTWEIYTVIIVGTIIRLVCIDFLIEITKIIARFFKKIFRRTKN